MALLCNFLSILYSVFWIQVSNSGSMFPPPWSLYNQIIHYLNFQKVSETAVQHQLSPLCTGLKADVEPILHTLLIDAGRGEWSWVGDVQLISTFGDRLGKFSPNVRAPIGVMTIRTSLTTFTARRGAAHSLVHHAQ